MNQFLALLTSRRFLPLFLTQFLGAFNGNLFKSAAIMLMVYRLGGPGGGKVAGSLAAAAFVLPFFLFSASCGHVADRHDKAGMIRATKILEVLTAAAAAMALQAEIPWLLLAAILLFGLQATAFGPLKYGILPDHLPAGELLAANALVEAATFVAILLGTILGSLIAVGPAGPTLVSALAIATALAGWGISRAIPSAPSVAALPPVSPNFLGETARLLRELAADRPALWLIAGISWFWTVGATFLAQSPAFAHDVLGADETVVTLILAMFTLGIGVGSLLCQRLLKGIATLRLAPLGAIGMAVFGADFALSAGPLAAREPLAGLGILLAQPSGWRLIGDLLALAIAGGVFVVPLYALLQARAAPVRRARVIAANNVMNALFMTLAGGGAAALLALGLPVSTLLATTAGLNLLVAVPLMWIQRRALFS